MLLGKVVFAAAFPYDIQKYAGFSIAMLVGWRVVMMMFCNSTSWVYMWNIVKRFRPHRTGSLVIWLVVYDSYLFFSMPLGYPAIHTRTYVALSENRIALTPINSCHSPHEHNHLKGMLTILQTTPNINLLLIQCYIAYINPWKPMETQEIYSK